MRFVIPVLSSLALLGCGGPPIPDSGAGVGFGDYAEYQTRTSAGDAALPPAGAVSSESLDAVRAEPTATAVPAQAPVPSNARASASPSISDEQEFSAVSGRETIESDAARIQANRDRFQQIEPTALPSLSEGAGPNIVQYALSTSNQVGEALYSRFGLFATNRFNRNCAQFTSQDLAQEAFLANGGPEKDRQGLDPDGDGFACYWDPAPFRAVRAATAEIAVSSASDTDTPEQ
ncbi:excalibur calcium-binding domain-containing protein [Cochlodiniinecator piscidefendens]|uniref:excalibur calcium-binding domain-containing protein n=1 Tax=Cochlodiniinecator piscidefendens TaxID=2715756 RepID=UPI001408627F|nr:excalibur calcium-binding domain-containing protein [Cochlodiniinecator piscidefendens]